MTRVSNSAPSRPIERDIAVFILSFSRMPSSRHMLLRYASDAQSDDAR